MTSDRSRRAADARMSQHLALGSIIGATLGATIGVATGDFGFWAAIGIPLGVACGFATSGGGRLDRAGHQDRASR